MGAISRRAGPSSGPDFIRILSYFKEDGAKSVAQIEQAMREQNTTALVLPAHTIKGEARQLGAEPLAMVAELIEMTARFCIETHRFPGRACARRSSSCAACSTRRSSCSTKRPTRWSRRAAPGGFGRKVSNQGFGRI